MFKQTFTFGSQSIVAEIDESALPAASVAFALAYGLRQYLSDGAAISKDAKGDRDVLKREGVEKRLAKLLDGSCTTRERTTDPVARERKIVIDLLLRAWLKVQNKKMPSDEAKAAKVVAWFTAANAEDIDALVKSRLAAAARQTERMSAAADDILANLFDEQADGGEEADGDEEVDVEQEVDGDEEAANS